MDHLFAYITYMIIKFQCFINGHFYIYIYIYRQLQKRFATCRIYIFAICLVHVFIHEARQASCCKYVCHMTQVYHVISVFPDFAGKKHIADCSLDVGYMC